MRAAIVLAGGRSHRMGRDKASLDWHGVPLLVHVCAAVRRGAAGGPVVVVRSVGQPLPQLPPWVTVVEDSMPGVGPMQGLLDGLRALPVGIEGAFLAGVDAASLCPALPRVLLGLLAQDESADALVPYVRGYRHPLLAAYRPSSAERIALRLAAGERRAGQVFDGRLRLVREDELLAAGELARQDPSLRSFDDVDTPEEYADALAIGLPSISSVAGGTVRPREALRLGDLAALEGLDVALVSVRIDGVPVDPDPLLVLAAGDVVSFD